MKGFGAWIALIAVIGTASSVLGQPQKEKKDEQTVVAKTEDLGRAKFIDFAGQLGLRVEAVSSLGERIDAARLAADPIDLAAMGKLLEALESASGKSASLTSKQLSEEAVALAKQRGNLAELAAVSKLIDGPEAKELDKIAEQIKSESTPEPGEVARDLEGRLIVDNHSHSDLHIYVDGYEVGHVAPHSVSVFYVHHAHHAVARDHFGHRWVAHFDYGHYHNYRMLIHDPHHPH